MRNWMEGKWGVCALIFTFALTMTLAACGGGSSAPDPGNPGQGNGNLPGQQQTGQLGTSANPVVDSSYNKADAPKAQPVAGVSAEAPLGTNPAYNMQPLGASVTGHEASKAGSVAVVIPGDDVLRILDITMAHDGDAPDFQLNHQVFDEGENIDLYMLYEMVQPDTINRRWVSNAIGLDYTENSIVHSATGIFTVKLDYTIPFGTARENAVYTYYLEASDGTIAESPDFLYDILSGGTCDTPRYPVAGDAQMAWEDLIVNSDYDYNDFVSSMNITEWRLQSSGDLVQIQFKVKALARGAGYDHAWQFNIASAFPGATVTSSVQQYKANGSPAGPQRIWRSTQGTDIPVFTQTREALPEPPSSFATNTLAGTKFIDGDYAVVNIIFDSPVKSGTWTPMPYNPQLKVYASTGNVYNIGLWRKKGDAVDTNGRPLAFIVPATYAWPLEYKRIWTVYPGFNNWVNWINDRNPGSAAPSPLWFNTVPVRDSFQRNLFN